MRKEKKYDVKSFSMKRETIGRLRETAAKVGGTGGLSWIVEDAVSSWLNRYEADPERWVLSRGVPVHKAATEDI